MAEEEEMDMAALMAEMEKEGADNDGAKSGDDTDMAAAMEGEGGLSQDEIDSLLGFGTGEEAPTSGIRALMERSLQTYERLPMLEVVFDRFVRSMSTSLRNFTSENVDVNIEVMISTRFEDYLNSVPLPALLAIVQAVEWENFALMTVDSSLTYSMVDVLLGGGRTHRPVRVEGRPFTTIEQDIVKSLARIMLNDMSVAFNPLTSVTFHLDKLETNPRFATITRPSNAVIVVTLRVEMDDRGGKADIVLPYVTLEPVKDLLLQLFSGETFGADDSWEDHLTNEIRNTQVRLDAVMKPKMITIKELADMEVGSTIVLDQKPGDPIDIKCQGVKLLSGILGAADNNMALRITDTNQKDIHKIL